MITFIVVLLALWFFATRTRGVWRAVLLGVLVMGFLVWLLSHL